MQTLPLHFANNHLLVTLDGRDWLLDTGGSVSFGSTPSIRVDQQEFSLSQGFLGLTPAILSEYINAPVAGLLGVDIMNELDVLIDAPEKTIIFSKDPLSCNGSAVPMEEFMGLPIIDATINGIAWRMFFDSGAQLSYFEDKIIKDYPETGTVEDFYPGLGKFHNTNSHGWVIHCSKRISNTMWIAARVAWNDPDAGKCGWDHWQ